jgi:hypothetical protein
MSVSVVRSDKTLFEGGYGVTDIETRKPVSENTLFGIASLSKGQSDWTNTLLFVSTYCRSDCNMNDSHTISDNEETNKLTNKQYVIA